MSEERRQIEELLQTSRKIMDAVKKLTEKHQKIAAEVKKLTEKMSGHRAP